MGQLRQVSENSSLSALVEQAFVLPATELPDE
jgi:hypothetical protein